MSRGGLRGSAVRQERGSRAAGSRRAVLPVSAAGDHFYKRNKNLPPEEQMISALPDIKVLTINDDHDFMVIACDGIW